MYTTNRKLEDNATKCVQPAIYRPTHATVSVICVMTNKWTRWRSLVAMVTSLTQRLRHSAKRKLLADRYQHWPVLTTTCGTTYDDASAEKNFTAVGSERCNLQGDNSSQTRGYANMSLCKWYRHRYKHDTPATAALFLDSVASNRLTDIYIYIHICIHLSVDWDLLAIWNSCIFSNVARHAASSTERRRQMRKYLYV